MLQKGYIAIFLCPEIIKNMPLSMRESHVADVITRYVNITLSTVGKRLGCILFLLS